MNTIKQQLLQPFFLISYLIYDLKSVAVNRKNDAANNVEAEAILSQLLTQIEEKFEAGKNNYYLRLVLLLDLKVFLRVSFIDELNRLLDREEAYLTLQIKLTVETSLPIFMKLMLGYQLLSIKVYQWQTPMLI